jgi:hypothetical protein
LTLLFLSLVVVSFFSAPPFAENSLTAFATANTSANITVNVSDTISIVILDSVIDFGNCTLDQSRVNVFDSSQANTSNSGCDNVNCVDIYSGSSDFFIIENDGNVDANLSVATNKTANDVFMITNTTPSTDSMYAYRGPTLSLACSGNLQTTFNNMSSANVYYPICDNFSFDDSSDELKVYAKVYVDGGATIGGSVTWIFQASSI